jgi:hypothetical protein
VNIFCFFIVDKFQVTKGVDLIFGQSKNPLLTYKSKCNCDKHVAQKESASLTNAGLVFLLVCSRLSLVKGGDNAS